MASVVSSSPSSSSIDKAAQNPKSLASSIITIVGAGGRLGGHVVYMLLKEFISESPVIRLLSTERSKLRTEGLALDLMDSVPSTSLIEVYTDMDKAFNDANYVLLLASAPKQDHYERHDLLPLNTPLYQQFASSISIHAQETCLIVIVANPVIDLCRVMADAEPVLIHRISAVVAVDQLRAERQQQDATQDSDSPSIRPLYVLGDHSVVSPMKILGCDDEMLHCTVQGRGREIITKFGGTAIYSVVESIRRHLLACFYPDIGPPLTMGIYVMNENNEDKTEEEKEEKNEPRRRGMFMSVPGRLIDGKFDIDPTLLSEHHETFLQYTSPPPSTSPPSSSSPCAIPSDKFHHSPSPIIESRLSKARIAIHESKSVYLLLGAGLSVDCGIPYLQGKFEETFPVLVKQGIKTIFDVSNISAFEKYPKLAWGFFGSRAKAYMKAKPSSSYTLLKQLLERNIQLDDDDNNDNQLKAKNEREYFMETTNIDNLLVRSGLFSESSLYERHGTVFDVQCTSPCCTAPTRRVRMHHNSDDLSSSLPDVVVKKQNIDTTNTTTASCQKAQFEDQNENFFDQLEIDEDTMEAQRLPLCPLCHSIERPATVLAVDYGLKLHSISLKQKNQRKLFVYNSIQKEPNNVVILEIGVGTQTSKLRHRSSTLVRERRAQFPNATTTFIRVNPIAFDISQTEYHSTERGGNISLPMTAHEFLSKM